MGFFRPTYAEINLQALAHNFGVVRSMLPRDTGVLAMVKADAYGHGAVRIAGELERSGVTALGVATVEEGLELRESGIKGEIVVMGGLMGMGSPASGMMVGASLTPVVHNVGILDFLEAVSRAAEKVIGVHLKIDTGMGRLGALPSSVERLLQKLAECSHIRLDGVMTHFADAENTKNTSRQMNEFKAVAREIESKIGRVKIWHCANSAAMIGKKFVFPVDESTTWVRPGIMLYGAFPSGRHIGKLPLKPVMSLKSSVALVKTVEEGTPVSYGCTFVTKRKTRLGVIPIGYADGYPWSLSNKASVLINGRRAPIAGRVTMDMIVVDITDIEAHVGTEVVLLGAQGDEDIRVEELAELAGSIPYEFFCGISKRMPRVYIGDQ